MDRHVIVIDDSAVVRSLLTTALSHHGYTVSGFSDGLQALHALLSPHAEHVIPVCVIVDIGLPGMDGSQVLRALRKCPAYAHTTFVVLTGRDSALERLCMRIAGASEYLTKPFTIQQVLAALRAEQADTPSAACKEEAASGLPLRRVQY